MSNTSNNNNDNNGGGGGGGGGPGPCGACKFLRRKCVKGCVFAPYFESDQLGTTHFAAVHKVFGASNASKLLLRLPPHKRLDAVVSLCYEALSRVTDPVYGCVAHIFTLQQQVVNLQAELAYTQARLSILQRLPLPFPQPSPELQASDSDMSTCIEPSKSEQPSFEMPSFSNSMEKELEDDDDLQRLAREFVSKYLPGVRFWPSN